MPVIFDRAATPALIRLEGEIDIALAAELKAALVEALAAGGEVRVSVEAAAGIDITAMQLLWAAEREAAGSGTVVALRGPVPETLTASLREAGFERFPFVQGPPAGSEAR